MRDPSQWTRSLTIEAASTRTPNDSPSPDAIHIRLVGVMMAVDTSGENVLPKGRRPRAIVAMLALEPDGRLSRNRLAATLWDRSGEKEAKGSLRTALREIKLAMNRGDREVVRSDNDHVWLDRPQCRIDAHEILASSADGEVDLTQLSKLGNAGLLEELDGTSSSFDQWLIIERRRLEERVANVCEATLLRLKETGASPKRRAAAARYLVELDPAHEVAARELIHATFELGDRIGALREFERFRKALRSIHDVAPGRETIALYEAIKRSAISQPAQTTAQISRQFIVIIRHRGDANPLESSEGSHGQMTALLAPPPIDQLAADIIAQDRTRTVIACDRSGDLLGVLARYLGSHNTTAATSRFGEAPRIGMHAQASGPSTSEGPADAQSIADGLSQIATPGQLLVSATVRDLFTDGIDARFEDLGDRDIAGFSESLRAFAVSEQRVPASVPKIRVPGDGPSIAVLPLRVLSSDPDHVHLADGIIEDVIGALARLQGLMVISRLSTLAFRDRPIEPQQVGATLGVRYVLSGSLRVSGARVRINVELVDSYSGAALSSEKIEGALRETFEVQDQLTHNIVSRLAPFVHLIELRRAREKQNADLGAYGLMLQGIDHLHTFSRASFEIAGEFFHNAIARDGGYAAPHAWLAKWHLLRIGQGWTNSPKEDTAAADAHVGRALQIDGTEPLALAVHGHIASFIHRDFRLANERFDRALAVAPSSPPAWLWSALPFIYLGDGPTAIERVSKAIALTPFDPLMFSFSSVSGHAHLIAGKYEKAIEMCEKSRRENRLYLSTLRVLAIAASLAGEKRIADRTREEMLELDPAFTAGQFRNRYPTLVPGLGDRFAAALIDAGVAP